MSPTIWPLHEIVGVGVAVAFLLSGQLKFAPPVAELDASRHALYISRHICIRPA